MRTRGSARGAWVVCEMTQDNGKDCIRLATYTVSVGNRKYDAQLSCRAHLPRTVEVMAAADNRTTVTVEFHRYGIRKEEIS